MKILYTIYYKREILGELEKSLFKAKKRKEIEKTFEYNKMIKRLKIEIDTLLELTY
jgi:hypothetical protein